MIAGVTGVLEVRTGRRPLPAAVTPGIVSQLVGDVVFAIVVDPTAMYELVLWPFVPVSPDASTGMLASIAVHWNEFVGFLRRPRDRMYLVAGGRYAPRGRRGLDS